MKGSIDLTVGSPWKGILLFCVPILISNIFQQLYSMVDTIIVGQTISLSALAAVGCTGSISFLVIGFVSGITSGFGVMMSQYFGAKKVIARANDPRNLETMRVLGVDYAVSSTEIIAQMIEQEANLMEFHLVASLNKGRGQICSVTLGENSALHGKSVREVVFPKGALLISIVRNNKLIIPGGDTVLQAGDEIIAVCEERAQKALIRLMNSTHADEK